MGSTPMRTTSPNRHSTTAEPSAASAVMPDAIADRFGTSRTLTLGIEDELLLVDSVTHKLTHESGRFLAAMALPWANAHHELYKCCLELASPVCEDVPNALDSLAELRRRLWAAGASAIGAGVHPVAQPGDAPTREGARYQYAEHLLGAAALRTPECALQVH